VKEQNFTVRKFAEQIDEQLHYERERVTSPIQDSPKTKRRKTMKDSELRTRAKALALHIIAVCDEVDTRKGRGVLVNQIVRSATSIGANIHEANYAVSKADFINKFHIALKECSETEYWVEMLVGSNAISEQTAKDLLQECGIIRRMLVKSITTAKENV
jgi:four helix bundle protein